MVRSGVLAEQADIFIFLGSPQFFTDLGNKMTSWRCYIINLFFLVLKITDFDFGFVCDRARVMFFLQLKFGRQCSIQALRYCQV